jgi:hypothetical protein
MANDPSNNVPGQVPGPPFFPDNPPLPVATTPNIPFDNMITEDPNTNGGYDRVQNFPNNGPYRPPEPPNTQPQTFYEYIAVPRLPIVPPSAPFFDKFTSYQQIEYELTLKNIYADRVDLINGYRIYRIPNQYLWKLDYDANGPFIGRPPLPTYRVTAADPTIGVQMLNDWIPLLG